MNLISLIWNLEHKFDVKIKRINTIENVFPLCDKYIASFVQRWVLCMFSITKHKYDVLTFHHYLHNQIQFALVGANLMKCTN
jgi:hypothetical protein